MKTKTKAIGISLALVLVTTLGVGQAFAANDTDVYLQADNSNISVTVPTSLTASIKADGTLTYPTSAQIENNSIFAVKVTGVSVADVSPYSVLSQAAYGSSSDADVLYTTVAANSGAVTDLISGSFATSDWNMAKAGESGDALVLTLAGAIKNLSTVPTSATQAYTVTWTVAAGSN